MDRFQYLGLMAGCLLLTLPLEFVFDARVYRRPRRLVRAVGPAVAVFYLWDVLAIRRGHWSFNPQYTTGWTLPLGVPVEELAFFIVIPICALLALEAVRNLLDRGWRDIVAARFVSPAEHPEESTR